MDIREAENMTPEEEMRHWWTRTRFYHLGAALREAVRRFDKVDVLEVGCGTVQNIRFLRGESGESDRIGRVIGVEPAMREEVFHSWMKPGDAVVKSVEAAPAGLFQLLVAMDVIEHVDDDVGALQFWTGRLAPAGLVFITVPAFQRLWSSHDEALGHKRRYSLAQLREVARRAGLRPIWIGYIFSWALPLVYLWRIVLRRGRRLGSDLTKTNSVLNFLFTILGRVEAAIGPNRLIGTSVAGLFELSTIQRRSSFSPSS